MATTKFTIDISDVLKNLSDIGTKSEIAIRMYAQEGAKKFENYAKLNRPWTDRTGHARQRLTGYIETNPTNTRVYISHGVDYGKYLELAHEKKYAILLKTVIMCADEVLDGFDNLISKLR